eukprot:COSAG02_NODE_1269_length_13533_cov_7.935016_9_plen_104_part_00
MDKSAQLCRLHWKVASFSEQDDTRHDGGPIIIIEVAKDSDDTSAKVAMMLNIVFPGISFGDNMLGAATIRVNVRLSPLRLHHLLAAARCQICYHSFLKHLPRF